MGLFLAPFTNMHSKLLSRNLRSPYGPAFVIHTSPILSLPRFFINYKQENMNANVHHTQRRVACRACRKSKAKCQRFQPNDAQCARCFLMKIHCVVGEQGKVGRPRRQAAVAAAALSTANQQQMHNKQEADDVSQTTVGHHVGNLSFPAIDTFDDDNNSTTKADAWAHLVDVHDTNLTWDMSREPNLASLDVSTICDNSDFGSHVAFPRHDQPAMALSPRWSSGVPFPNSLEAPYPLTELDCLSELQRISFDLHLRSTAMNQHRDALDLDMVIYQRGPLFINGITYANLVIKASQSFVDSLFSLKNISATKAAVASSPSQPLTPASPPRLATPPTATLALSDLSLPYSPPRPRIARQPLSTPLALAITSVFAQLVEVHELHARLLYARMQDIDNAPVAPFPGVTFDNGATMVSPCVQGTLFTNMVLYQIERMERALGIVGNPEGGEALLSPRQMDVLWSELSGENGNKHVGMARSKLLKRAWENVRFVLKQASLKD